jgi:hypothetical protein
MFSVFLQKNDPYGTMDLQHEIYYNNNLYFLSRFGRDIHIQYILYFKHFGVDLVYAKIVCALSQHSRIRSELKNKDHCEIGLHFTLCLA